MGTMEVAEDEGVTSRLRKEGRRDKSSFQVIDKKGEKMKKMKKEEK